MVVKSTSWITFLKFYGTLASFPKDIRLSKFKSAAKLHWFNWKRIREPIEWDGALSVPLTAVTQRTVGTGPERSKKSWLSLKRHRRGAEKTSDTTSNAFLSRILLVANNDIDELLVVSEFRLVAWRIENKQRDENSGTLATLETRAKREISAYTRMYVRAQEAILLVFETTRAGVVVLRNK